MAQFLKALLVALSLMAGALLAQDADLLGSRFFRVTITPNDKPLLAGSIFEDTAGKLIMKGASLATIIARAYGTEGYAVVDAPEWTYQIHLYDIEAEPPPESLVASNEAQMLQAMLADRFSLQLRRETRDVEMVVLDIDRARQDELRRAADEARAAERALLPDADALNRGVDAERAANFVRLGYVPVSTQALIRGYSRAIGEPVHDLTGTSGVYVLGGHGIVRALPEPETLATIAARLVQSGLILERRRVPLDVIVVTAIERPVLDTIDR